MHIEDYYWYTNDHEKRMKICKISRKMDYTPVWEQIDLARDTTDELTLVALHQRYTDVRIEVVKNKYTPARILLHMASEKQEPNEYIRLFAKEALLAIKSVDSKVLEYQQIVRDWYKDV